MFRQVDLNIALITSFNTLRWTTEQKTRLGKQLSFFLLILQKKQYHSQTSYNEHNESSDKSKKQPFCYRPPSSRMLRLRPDEKNFTKNVLALAKTAHHDFQTYSPLDGFGARMQGKHKNNERKILIPS